MPLTKKKKRSRIDLNQVLIKLKACRDAREWCEGKTPIEAWNTCNDLSWIDTVLGKCIKHDYLLSEGEEYTKCPLCMIMYTKTGKNRTPSEIRKIVPYRKLLVLARKSGLLSKDEVQS